MDIEMIRLLVEFLIAATLAVGGYILHSLRSEIKEARENTRRALDVGTLNQVAIARLDSKVDDMRDRISRMEAKRERAEVRDEE